jgi:hypothetical protein
MIGENADRPEWPASITVVTPVHERSEMVGRLLTSLSEAIDAFAQDGGSADVMLVDSSAGPEARRIQALAGRHARRADAHAAVGDARTARAAAGMSGPPTRIRMQPCHSPAQYAASSRSRAIA